MSNNTPVRTVTVDAGINLKLSNNHERFSDEMICEAYGRLKCEKELCLISIIKADYYYEAFHKFEAEKQDLVEKNREIAENLPKINQNNLENEDLIRNLVENQEYVVKSAKQMEHKFKNEINQLNMRVKKMSDELRIIRGMGASFKELIEKMTDQINKLKTENDDVEGKRMRESTFKRSATENKKGKSNLAKVKRTIENMEISTYNDEQTNISTREKILELDFTRTRIIKQLRSQNLYEIPKNTIKEKSNGEIGPVIISNDVPILIKAAPKQINAVIPVEPAVKSEVSSESRMFFENFNSYLMSVASKIRENLVTIDAAVGLFLEIDPTVVQMPKDKKDEIREVLLNFGNKFFQ